MSPTPSPTDPVSQGPVHDLVGVGFGPANLSLAAVMEEDPACAGLERLFFDAKPEAKWHPGMLLEDSLLQITVLKDLVTVHNPCSRFTFLNYLKEKGRLYEWLNLRELYPTRLEFNDYLTWAADLLAHRSRYGRKVERIEPVAGNDGGVDVLRVVSRRTADDVEEAVLARQVVVAAGGEPVAPPGIEVRQGGRVIHSHVFLQRLEDTFPDRQAPYRFVVVGAGQSGAEIFLYLLRHYPNADVTAVHRGFSYKPADGSDYTNSVFFPEWVDFHNRLPDAKRRVFFERTKDVNYAVIDEPLIHEIFKTLYRQKVAGKERGRIQPFLHLERVEEDGAAAPGRSVRAEFRHLMLEDGDPGENVTLEADGLVLCTGYLWRKEHPVLDPLAPYFERDDLGGYAVERDYGIRSREGFRPRVYLQGYCEDTHGISETVLSLLPVRAADILRSLLERSAASAAAEEHATR